MQKRKPYKKLLLIGAMVAVIAFLSLAIWYLRGLQIDILDPKGIVALKQYNLFVFTLLLGMIVVIPVFIMTIVIAWRYRESNTKAAYTPNASHNTIAETIWWGIPVILIVILSVVTWNSTHDLDPYKSQDVAKESLNIQVVALDWKWLFIYPEQGIATVNYVQFPTDVPVKFDITADAPMNSFWIPQLGGQIYAMAGMTTTLHLDAMEHGEYKGSSANISGEGFSGMKFIAKSTSQSDFDTWVNTVQQSPNALSTSAYDNLAKKSSDNPVALYNNVAPNLYDTIVMKYMMPTEHKNNQSHTPGMDHSTMEMH